MEPIKNEKTVAEYFAGIGLMREGLEKSGWTVVFANDIDPAKQKIYENHFVDINKHFVLDDIHNLTLDQIPPTSLATASFPCTDLSLAGRRAGLRGENSSAFWGFVRILRDMGFEKPPLILLENVAGFLTSRGGKDFEDALLALNNLGYAVDAFVVDASHFVPQSRVRLFIVGKQHFSILNTIHLKMPESTIRPAKLIDFIYNHPSIAWNINQDLPDLPKLEMALVDIIEEIPANSPLWFSTERVEYLLNQTFERHLAKVIEQQARDCYDYYTAFRRIRDGKSMAEIRFDGIAGCLRTPKGGSAKQILLQVGKGEINIRLLTPSECAKLMGANNFFISGTTNESLFGFGDAVCVPVVSWIADNYLNAELAKLEQHEACDFENYATSA